MIVRWLQEAEQDRVDIFSYIEAENPAAAAEFDEKLTRVADRLADFPYIGRPGLYARDA